MMGICINLSVLCLGKIGGESSKTDDDANGVNEIETSNDSWCDCKQFLVTKMLRKGRLEVSNWTFKLISRLKEISFSIETIFVLITKLI